MIPLEIYNDFVYCSVLRVKSVVFSILSKNIIICSRLFHQWAPKKVIIM